MSNTKRPTEIIFSGTIEKKEREFLVRRPNMPQQREGQRVYNRAFNDAISSGALLRAKLDDFMREQGMWDDAKAEEMTRLGKDCLTIEKSLAKGGIKLSAARTKALDLRRLRGKVRDLIEERTQLDIHTAEGQADNARFNYWVSACLVYNDSQKTVFDGIDTYLENQTEDYAADGAGKLAQLLYNLSEDYDDKLEENQFLREFGFADEQNRLVNTDGHLVDEKDRLVNDKGSWVNSEGSRVDSDGNLLNEDGNYDFERKPFLDEEDKPIHSCVEECSEEEGHIAAEPEPSKDESEADKSDS